MNKKDKQPAGEICNAACPKCKNPNGCQKGWQHVLSKSVHWCLFCGHTWPS